MGSSPSGGLNSFSPLGSSRGGPAGILLFHSMPALLHLGNSTTSGCLGVECLQLSLDLSGKLCVSSSCISSSSSVQVSGRTCQNQLRHLILVTPCWMEAPWLPAVLNMLADDPRQCPIIKDLIMDVLESQEVKGLLCLCLTLLAAEQCVLCREGFS